MSTKLKVTPKSHHFDLLIKSDTDCHKNAHLYGASKIRKLAYILPSILPNNPQALLTVGSEGSHHVLATCIAGQELGLPVRVALSRQVHSDHSLQVYERTRSIAQSVTHFTALNHQKFARELAIWKQSFDPQKYAFIPTGGSCLFGTFGMVEAVYELVDQIFHDHRSPMTAKMPVPTDIYMATASGSSLAGLLLGLSIAWPKHYQIPQVFGVRVSDQSLVNRQKILTFYQMAANYLAHQDLAKASPLPPFEILGDFIGEGYGISTLEAQQAMAWSERLGLKLDLSYTAKAFGALLSRERRLWIKSQRIPKKRSLTRPRSASVPQSKDKVFLFWHSLDTTFPVYTPFKQTIPNSQN